ncbi:MAG: hypothetical protein QM500_21045 [Methylococcales bacterium]
MNIQEIKSKKRIGDLKSAGDMIGINKFNAYAALNREGSKYHDRIVNALSKIIEARQKLEDEFKTPIDESVINKS